MPGRSPASFDPKMASGTLCWAVAPASDRLPGLDAKGFVRRRGPILASWRSAAAASSPSATFVQVRFCGGRRRRQAPKRCEKNIGEPKMVLRKPAPLRPLAKHCYDTAKTRKKPLSRRVLGILPRDLRQTFSRLPPSETIPERLPPALRQSEH